MLENIGFVPNFLISDFSNLEFFWSSISTKTTLAPTLLRTCANLEPNLPAEPVRITVLFFRSNMFVLEFILSFHSNGFFKF